MVAMFKIKSELAPPIMDSMFDRRNESKNLCNFQEFLAERKRTVHYGFETFSYRSPMFSSTRKQLTKLNHQKFLKEK